MHLGRLVIPWGFALFTLSANAEVYQWRDEQGHIHFGDKPARHLNASPVELEPLNTMTPVSIPKDLFKARRPDKPPAKPIPLPRLKRGLVLMYTTPTCVFCGRAKDYMKRKGIPYEEKDITASQSAREEFVSYGGRGVPLLLVGTSGGTVKVRGFSEARFESVYDSP